MADPTRGARARLRGKLAFKYRLLLTLLWPSFAIIMQEITFDLLIGIERSQDIKYMRYLRFFLVLVGGWPGKPLGDWRRSGRWYQWLNVALSVLTLVLGLLYVRNNISKLSYFEMGKTYITVVMNCVCLSRFCTFMTDRYEKSMVYFVKDIHLFNHRNDSEYAMKMHMFVHKLCHCFTLYTIGLVSTVAEVYDIVPVVNNAGSGAFRRHPPADITYESVVYYALPFDYEHDAAGFYVVFIYNLYISYICSVLFLIFDLLVALMVFHLWGHLKILTYSLDNFPRPGEVFEGQASVGRLAGLRYTDRETEEVTRRLKDIIIYHEKILKYSENISNTVGLSVAVYYMFHQITTCLLLLECSQLDTKALVRFGPLCICLINLLAQVSVIFELLGSRTEPLMRAAYNVPWEVMEPGSRRLVLMLLRQTQTPLGLKAVGMVEVGVQTMATILKTSLSYFMMLRTMATNK